MHYILTINIFNFPLHALLLFVMGAFYMPDYAAAAPVITTCKDLSAKGALAMYGQPDLGKTKDLRAPPNILNPAVTKEKTTLRLTQTEPFSGLNPFISGGGSPFILKSYLYDSMMWRSPAEPFTLYPQIVGVKKMAPDRSNITFEIAKNAKFNDNSLITTKDILFTFDLLKNHGRYNYQMAYKHIEANIINEKIIRFDIKNANRELPLILGLMPVLSHKNTINDFKKQNYKGLLASSAYAVLELKDGVSVALKKRDNYWNKSCYRFFMDKVYIEFFKNEQAAFEQLKIGEIDFFHETNINRLHRAYSFRLMNNHYFKQEKMAITRPSGLYGFVFNTRKEPWSDPILRQAIVDLFDFDTMNKNYLYNNEHQITNIWMTPKDIPKPTKKTMPDPRDIKTQTIDLLKSHHYYFKQGSLYTPKDKPVQLTIFTHRPHEEKYAIFLKDTLKNIGITTHIQRADSAIYYKRLRDYDYDMILDHRYVSWSPGTEQHNYWGCSGRDKKGTRNYAGICNQIIENTLKDLDKAKTHKELTSVMEKINAEVLSGNYYIPLEAKLYDHIIRHKDLHISAFGAEYYYWQVNEKK